MCASVIVFNIKEEGIPSLFIVGITEDGVETVYLWSIALKRGRTHVFIVGIIEKGVQTSTGIVDVIEDIFQASVVIADISKID